MRDFIYKAVVSNIIDTVYWYYENNNILYYTHPKVRINSQNNYSMLYNFSLSFLFLGTVKNGLIERELGKWAEVGIIGALGGSRAGKKIMQWEIVYQTVSVWNTALPFITVPHISTFPSIQMRIQSFYPRFVILLYKTLLYAEITYLLSLVFVPFQDDSVICWKRWEKKKKLWKDNIYSFNIISPFSRNHKR